MKLLTNSKIISSPKRPIFNANYSLNVNYYSGIFSIFRIGARIYLLDGTYISIPQANQVDNIVVSGDGKAWYRNNEYTNVDYIVLVSSNSGEKRGFSNV